jgi:hypothetical protein
MADFINWNWQAEHVQTEIQNGEYVSSESTLVLAGPARLSMLSGQAVTEGGDVVSSANSLIPLGLLQNIAITQNRQLTRLFEIGSKRSYFVPGRLFANFSIGRIMFFGPSLLRLLYALAPVGASRRLGPFGQILGTAEDDSNGGAATVTSIPKYDNLFPSEQLKGVPGWGGTPGETNRDFFVNLASELFNVPFGLVLVFKDTRNRPYGAMFLEDCYIESHQMGVDANQVVIAESVTGQFDSVAPIQLATGLG